MTAAFREEIDPPKIAARLGSIKRRFTAVRLDAICLPPKTEDLVQDVLSRALLAVVFGESGCCKSFFVSSMSGHISVGRAWGDKATAAGAVVYVTAEGARRLMKRMVAFRQQLQIESGAQFYVIADAPDLGHADSDAEELILRIRQQVGSSVALVVIDTMARVMQGADENSAKEVSVLIQPPIVCAIVVLLELPYAV